MGSFAKGKAFYMSSTLHNEGRHAELQIFDPNDFGKVLKREDGFVAGSAGGFEAADGRPLAAWAALSDRG